MYEWADLNIDIGDFLIDEALQGVVISAFARRD